MIQFRDNEYQCTSEISLSLIRGKWKVLILSYLDQRTFRFNELHKLMPDTTQKMLTMQLRELESSGLITRKVYPVAPPKVEYLLTELGKKLVPILYMLRDFGLEYIETIHQINAKPANQE